MAAHVSKVPLFLQERQNLLEEGIEYSADEATGRGTRLFKALAKDVINRPGTQREVEERRELRRQATGRTLAVASNFAQRNAELQRRLQERTEAHLKNKKQEKKTESPIKQIIKSNPIQIASTAAVITVAHQTGVLAPLAKAFVEPVGTFSLGGLPVPASVVNVAVAGGLSYVAWETTKATAGQILTVAKDNKLATAVLLGASYATGLGSAAIGAAGSLAVSDGGKTVIAEAGKVLALGAGVDYISRCWNEASATPDSVFGAPGRAVQAIRDGLNDALQPVITAKNGVVATAHGIAKAYRGTRWLLGQTWRAMNFAYENPKTALGIAGFTIGGATALVASAPLGAMIAGGVATGLIYDKIAQVETSSNS